MSCSEATSQSVRPQKELSLPDQAAIHENQTCDKEPPVPVSLLESETSQSPEKSCPRQLHKGSFEYYAPERGHSPQSGTKNVALPDPEPGRKKESDNERSLTALFYRWWWWWELAAVVLNITCMSMVVVFLGFLQDKPLESWICPIQPNSLVAVITTIGKTAMLVVVTSAISQLKWNHVKEQSTRLSALHHFDEASRGPWGAVVFLWQNRRNFLRPNVLLGSIGALITILALGVEPASQQILDFDSRTVVAKNMTAKLGKANDYSTRAMKDEKLFSRDLLKYHSAILDGIVGRAVTTQFDCPSSALECRWPEYTTLGVCSWCNVMEYREDCTNIPVGVFNFIKNLTCSYDVDNLTRSDGPIRLFYRPFDERPTILNTSIIYDRLFGQGDFVPGGILIAKSLDWPSEFKMSTAEDKPPVEVQYCTLKWCAMKYNGTKSTSRNLTEGTLTSEDLVLTQDSGSYANLSAPSMGLDFRVDIGLYKGRGMFKSPFHMVYNTLSFPLVQVDDPGWVISLKDNDLGAGKYLYQTDNISQLFESISNALTAQLRNQNLDNLNATFVEGEVLIKETYFRVRWAWLTLALLETILAAILLVCTIAVTCDQALWGHSIIAPLFHGLEGYDEDELGPTGREDAEELTKLSEEMTVILGENNRGAVKLLRR